MNRRDFIQRGAMATAAVVAASVAPAAALPFRKFADGCVVSGHSDFMIGETVGETILPKVVTGYWTIRWRHEGKATGGVFTLYESTKGTTYVPDNMSSFLSGKNVTTTYTDPSDGAITSIHEQIWP